MRIKKNDVVKVKSGASRGKTGKIIKVIPEDGTAVVQGINLLWKHMRRSNQYPHGARIQKEAPINISKLMLVCPNCNKPAKSGYKITESGVKNRICKKCSQVVAEA
ncbi:MAG: 50S ribosomal protein L24 [Planctomycetota bacterium]